MSRWNCDDRPGEGYHFDSPDMRPVLWVVATYVSQWHYATEEAGSRDYADPRRVPGSRYLNTMCLLPTHPDRVGKAPAYCPVEQWEVLAIQVRIDRIRAQQQARRDALAAGGVGQGDPRRAALMAARKAATGALEVQQRWASRLATALAACERAFGAAGEDGAAWRARADREVAGMLPQAAAAVAAADSAVAAFEAML